MINSRLPLSKVEQPVGIWWNLTIPVAHLSYYQYNQPFLHKKVSDQVACFGGSNSDSLSKWWSHSQLRITQLIESVVSRFNINFLTNPRREELLFPFFPFELEVGERAALSTWIGNSQKTTVKNHKIILRQNPLTLMSGYNLWFPLKNSLRELAKTQQPLRFNSYFIQFLCLIYS